MEDNRKVMIMGHVFPYKEKAPFVPSGVSIFGAAEYDMQRDKLRCHECGQWFASLGQHIAHGSHDITLREYKTKHGLRLQTSLVSRKGAAARSAASRARNSGNIESLRKRPDLAATFTTNKPNTKTRNTNEIRNDKGRCQAQLSLKIRSLAKELGRTPTTQELTDIGCGLSIMERTFKVRGLGNVMALLDLQPRAPGHRPTQETEWLYNNILGSSTASGWLKHSSVTS